MNKSEKIFFSIKEVALEIGESEPTIRYWEKEFHELKHKRKYRITKTYKISFTRTEINHSRCKKKTKKQTC